MNPGPAVEVDGEQVPSQRSSMAWSEHYHTRPNSMQLDTYDYATLPPPAWADGDVPGDVDWDAVTGAVAAEALGHHYDHIEVVHTRRGTLRNDEFVAAAARLAGSNYENIDPLPAHPDQAVYECTDFDVVYDVANQERPRKSTRNHSLPLTHRSDCGTAAAGPEHKHQHQLDVPTGEHVPRPIQPHHTVARRSRTGRV